MRADDALRAPIDALFELVWPRLPERIALAASLGADWHAVSTPFVALEGNEVVAHVGVIEIPLMLGGAPMRVAGVHAVATHPAHRYRGHCRRLVDEALRYLDERGIETAQLTTELPRVFRPAGFRELGQTCFELALPPLSFPPLARAPVPLRKLSHETPADVALLWRLLATRTPVSQRLGVLEPGWLFVIDEVLTSYGFERLYHAPDLGAVIALEVRDGVLRLYDVVAPELPIIEDVAARVTTPFTRLETYFSPDRFALPILREGLAYPGDAMMVRGPYPIEGQAFALPLLAHC